MFPLPAGSASADVFAGAEGRGNRCGKGNKKRPLPNGRGLCYLSVVEKSAAAGAGAAGAGAASSATADRVGGGDGKSRAVPGFNKVHFNRSAGVQQIFFNQKGEAVFCKSFVVVFWLIQSQSQGWASSAALHQGDANGGINIIL